MSDTTADYVKPDSLDAACDVLDTHGHDAKVVAGGQSLSLLLRQNLLNPSVIVDIGDLPELRGVQTEDGSVRIGAAATYNGLADSDAVTRVGGMVDAIDVIADAQVRNLGTIGGAIAHADPSLDILPPLLCLDATVVLAGPAGTRSVDFQEFYTGYMETDLATGEVVATIAFETPGDTVGTAYEKHANVSGGWATVGVGSAVHLADDGETIESGRIALAAVDDTPVRSPSAEAVLAGAEATPAVLEEAAGMIPEDIAPLEDLSGSVSYKQSLSERLARRSLDRSLDRATGGESR